MGEQEVFCLRVAGQHEYFANGVLVHNCDELAKYRYAREVWDMLQFTMRRGDDPRVFVSTTPRPIPIIRDLVAAKTTVVTRGSTFDNRENLAEAFIQQIITRYEGTRLGRQELQGEVLDDLPGALWNRDAIDQRRVKSPPDMQRIVVAVDPSGTKGDSDDGDSIGIVVAGKGVDGRGYILADRTCKLSPDGWGRRAVAAYHEFKADRIVAERNFGGAMVEHVIKTVDRSAAYKEVTASRGKVARAEPIAALYEQGRVSHVGSFSDLEDQMCLIGPDGYAGEGSPDRCFVAGTLIETERGPVPIESVIVGDRVWTRRGLRRVTAAGMTSATAAVVEAAFSDGSRLIGTGNHPVFAEGRGFTRMDALVWGDIISHLRSNEEWVAEKSSHSREENTFDTPIVRVSRRAATSTAEKAGGRKKQLFTATFGRMPTAPSLMDGTSTTSMKTGATTLWRTLPRYPQPGMPKSMKPVWPRTFAALVLNRRVAVRTRLANGIAAMKAAWSIHALVQSLGMHAFQSVGRASNAGSNMKISHIAKVIGFVRVGASASTMSGRGDTTKTEAALSVARSSMSRRASFNRSAPVRVVGLSAREKPQAVFNLTVDGENEYYANGVLVHNCDALVWALTELMLEDQASVAMFLTKRHR